ncbi:MAG: B12-binding domain-containing radical SAM protein [bacterium]|nr:B12-binding domain-containing radical SAM protein [bacterium]
MVQRYRVAIIEPATFPKQFAGEKGHKSVYTGVLMPRAIPALAAVLQEHGFEVRGWSGELSDINVTEIADWADCVCLSVMSNGATHGLMLAYQFGELWKPVIMGGYHFAQNELNEHTLQQTEEALTFGCSFVIRGEGYTSLPALLQLLARQRQTGHAIASSDLREINGLSWRTSNGRFQHNIAHLLDVQLTDLPLADWSALQDPDKTLRTLGVHGMSGCPRGCPWCGVRTRDGNGTNRNSDIRMVAEIEAALAVLPRIGHIFFSSDNIVVFRDWFLELCAELKRRDMKIPWSCQAEIPTLVKHPELLDAAAASGCVRFCLGLESINNQTLHDTDKHQTREEMEQVISDIHGAGIAVHGMFIVGLPGDTEADIERTLTWALAQRIETVQFLCLSDLPGSLEYEQLHLWESDQSYRPFTGLYAPLNWVFLNGHYVRRHSQELSLQQVQRLSVRVMQQYYRFDRLLGRLFKPRFEVWQGRRRQGKSRWQATKAMLLHQLVAFGLGLRGYTNIGSWLNPHNDLNQGYLASVEARTPAAREVAIEKMLRAFPPEWLTICELVATAEQAHRVTKSAVAIAAER